MAKNSKNELVSLGFPEFTIEDFHETVSSQRVENAELEFQF